MPERYENDIDLIMYRLVECAMRDREGMVGSLMSGYFGSSEEIIQQMKERNPDDYEYLMETKQLIRDFERFSRNRKIGAV